MTSHWSYMWCILSQQSDFLLQPLTCGTVFHRMSLLLPLTPSSAIILNHISSHFLIPLSDSSLICTVSVQWLVILDTIIVITLHYHTLQHSKYRTGLSVMWSEIPNNFVSLRYSMNEMGMFTFLICIVACGSVALDFHSHSLSLWNKFYEYFIRC